MKINSVLGPIDTSDLGVTLTHEHLHMQFDCVVQKPPKAFPSYPTKKEDTFTLKNLGLVRQYPYSSVYNCKLDDVDTKDVILDELRLFKDAGGSTIVENTIEGISRDIKWLKEISEKSGVNIIAGTGYYVACSQNPATLALRTEQMHDLMVKELTEGADDGIKCGIVGEVAISWPMDPFERRVIQAVAQVQEELNPPISFHPGRHVDSPTEILRVFTEAGGKSEDVVMSHLDRTLFKDETYLDFSTFKSFLQFDLFGTESSYYQLQETLDMMSDAQRIDKIVMLRDNGLIDRVTVSHDLHTKHRLTNFGGHGYSHILKNVVPKMRLKGLTGSEIDKILKDNPKRWLSRGNYQN